MKFALIECSNCTEVAIAERDWHAGDAVSLEDYEALCKELLEGRSILEVLYGEVYCDEAEGETLTSLAPSSFGDGDYFQIVSKADLENHYE